MEVKPSNLFNKLAFAVIACILTIVVVVVLIGSTASKKVETINPAAAATVVATSIAVPQPTPSVATFVLPPEKQKQQSDDATAIAEAQKHPATIPPNPLTPSTNVPDLGPTATPRTGIMEGNAPYKAQYAIIRTQWAGYINGKLITVYAGAYTQNLDQGFVAIQIGKPDDKDFSGKLKEIPSSIKEGKLTITSFNGTVLTLVTDKGTTLHFDAASLAFE